MRTFRSVALMTMGTVILGASGWGEGAAIPALQWETRSDWVNVKTDAALGAIGDG